MNPWHSLLVGRKRKSLSVLHRQKSCFIPDFSPIFLTTSSPPVGALYIWWYWLKSTKRWPSKGSPSVTPRVAPNLCPSYTPLRDVNKKNHFNFYTNCTVVIAVTWPLKEIHKLIFCSKYLKKTLTWSILQTAKLVKVLENHDEKQQEFVHHVKVNQEFLNALDSITTTVAWFWHYNPSPLRHTENQCSLNNFPVHDQSSDKLTSHDDRK